MSDEITSNGSEEQKHGVPEEGMCCLCTYEDITIEDGNYVEFQGYPSLKWKPALYEQMVVEKLLQDQFHNFVKRVKETDCQAELRRLLKDGPPIYLSDKTALPLEEGDTHVVKLWFSSDNLERSAKLDGAVTGTEREKLWDELREFIIVEGKEDIDKDDNDKEATAES